MMSTPFEELEYLAEYLPDEGESVLVTRQSGELVCESFLHAQCRDGVSDPEFYGRLVHWNERLSAQSTLPIWCCAGLLFWLCVLVHKLGGIGWEGWYLDVGLGLIVLMGCWTWIRRRQSALFNAEIRPALNWQIRSRHLDRFAILGVLRQHPELRTLMEELSRWEG